MSTSTVLIARTQLPNNELLNSPSGRVGTLARESPDRAEEDRRRRVLTDFLAHAVGFTTDQKGDEAGGPGQTASDTLIERVADYLANSARRAGTDCPTSIGSIPGHHIATPLTRAESGQTLAVTRIGVDEPVLLEYLTSIGVVVGSRLTIQRHRGNSDVTSIRIFGQSKDRHLGLVAADAVWAAAVDVETHSNTRGGGALHDPPRRVSQTTIPGTPVNNSIKIAVILRQGDASEAPAIALIGVNRHGQLPAVLVDPIDRFGRVRKGTWLGENIDDDTEASSYFRLTDQAFSLSTHQHGSPG